MSTMHRSGLEGNRRFPLENAPLAGPGPRDSRPSPEVGHEVICRNEPSGQGPAFKCTDMTTLGKESDYASYTPDLRWTDRTLWSLALVEGTFRPSLARIAVLLAHVLRGPH